MLDATTFDALMAAASVNGQCGGHNYQLVDFSQRRVLNLEAATHGQRFVTELLSDAEQAVLAVHPPVAYSNATVHTASALYHSNQYLFLQPLGGQSGDGSSACRQQRAMDLERTIGLPSNGAQLRRVMGDLVQILPQNFSIYRHGEGMADPDDPDADYTLHTALFDLDAESVTIYAGNPELANAVGQYKV
jgi:hypothetical protein